MTYCTATEALALNKVHKVQMELQVADMFPRFMDIIDDKIRSSAAKGKGNCSVNLHHFLSMHEKDSLDDAIMESLTAKLAEKFCQLGFRVVMDIYECSLNIVWKSNP